MKRLLPAILLCLCVATAAYADDESPPAMSPEERTVRALSYLASGVPELRLRAEAIVTRAAPEFFEVFEAQLDNLHPVARLSLLRILAATPHERRVGLCVGTLCQSEAQRAERVIAYAALRESNVEDLVAEIERRLQNADTSKHDKLQLVTLLGIAPSARSQSAAERVLRDAEPESLLAFAAEDAALRSLLHTPFAQPAWNRYRQRNPGTPDITLRELQDLLDDLALPTAIERANAEARLLRVVGDDERLLLALARSPWAERANFALAYLRHQPPRRLAIPAMLVMLDCASTAERTAALLALEVAIAGAPPSEAELDLLRPCVNLHAMLRLESIVEALFRAGDLAELRRRNDLLKARLRPLMLRNGALDAEVRRLQAELARVQFELSQLETLWAEGWRREFRPDILNTSGA